MKQCTDKSNISSRMWSWCFPKVCFLTFPLSVRLRGCCGCVCGLYECDWTQPAAREDRKTPGALHVCRRKLLHRDVGPALLLHSVCSGPQGSSWTHQALWVPERGWSGQRDGAFDWSSWEGGVNRQRCTSFLMAEEQSWTRAAVRSGDLRSTYRTNEIQN